MIYVGRPGEVLFPGQEEAFSLKENLGLAGPRGPFGPGSWHDLVFPMALKGRTARGKTWGGPVKFFPPLPSRAPAGSVKSMKTNLDCNTFV